MDILPPERQRDGKTDRQAEFSLLLSLCLSLQTQLILLKLCVKTEVVKLDEDATCCLLHV